MKIHAIVSAVVFVAVIGYVAWVFWSRAQTTQAVEERAAEERRERDVQTVEGMGGNRFEILWFYALPGLIHRGDSTDLCYGVSNAKSVTLDPESGGVWPAYRRCLSVSPKKTTTYTLTATDADGHTKTATVTVEVR